VANTPMSLEYTKIDYNQNWQNWGGKQNVFDVISWGGPTGPGFKANTDRSTDIIAFKAGHVFPVMGGLDTNFKWKYVRDEDKNDATTGADDRETKDNGFSVGVGNQLFSHLYASVSYGRYNRDIKLGAATFDNEKDIWSLRFNYNLPGFELGSIAQWIDGRGDPTQSGTQIDLRQYRLKVYVKAFL
jgi:outer membrane protein assembly factor BamA